MLRINVWKSLSALAFTAVAVSASAQDLAIVGGKIVTGAGTVLQKGTILIRDGKVVEVGATVDVPSGIATIDATGGTVYPGFIDGYTTKGVKNEPAPEAASRPSAVSGPLATMWRENRTGIRSRVEAAKNLDLGDVLKEALAVGFTQAYVAPRDGLVRGQGAVITFAEAPEPRPWGMVFNFRASGGGGGYPATLLGYTAHLRQTLHDAMNPSVVIVDGKPDPDLDPLSAFVGKRGTAVFAVDTEPDVVRAMEYCDAFGMRLVIAGGRDAFRRASQLAALKVPVLVSIAVGDEPSVEATESGPPKAVLEERRALWRERAANIVRLSEAGVPFAISSEGSSYSRFFENLSSVMSMGLSHDAAVSALTSQPAAILGIQDAGTLQPGKVGNVVILSGDLGSKDLKVKAVVVRGREVKAENGGAR
jgi:imidazolonepropionase-like amidohydrolase